MSGEGTAAPSPTRQGLERAREQLTAVRKALPLGERIMGGAAQALLSAVPVPDPTLRNTRKQIKLSGDVPSPANPPSGCRFHTRCFKAQEKCTTDVPLLVQRPDGISAHDSACHFAEPLAVVA